MRKIANRMSVLPVFYFATLAPKVQALRAAAVDVIRLDVGSPDLPPPEPVVAALRESALRPDRHGYTHHKGIPALREAWATLYQRAFGVELNPDREVVPLLGSKEGIFHLTQTLVEPGEVVLVPDPCYLTYASSALFAGGEVYLMPLRPEKNFLPDLGAVPMEIVRRAKMLWLNYPNNPTGAVAPLAFFEGAVAFAKHHDILLCHDAAYTQVTYDGFHAPSVLEVEGAKEIAVEFNTLSKSHNMAGWRVGVAVGAEAALDALYRMKTYADSGHFMPIQEAAVVAMTGDQDWIQARNGIYQQRRDLVVKALRGMGVEFWLPGGALYVWCACPGSMSSTAFAGKLLEKAGISLAPGSIFGANGEGYVRISLCVPEARLKVAMERLEEWWGKA